MVSPGAQSSSLVGSLIGKEYRVLEQIGIGGMAVVYVVEHQTLLKRFAAKVLSAEHASNKEARARFAQEAHAASQLDHENIVTISDFGITPDERPFYVMELLRGRTLADRIEEGPMTIEEVVAVSVPVARALAHAHAEGVIHRDVKPENVFLVVRTRGRWGVKVLDFGIAKVSSNPALTKMGQALGSPMFMAPEACRGDDVDQRADLYSFGIMLYTMLTGKVPFEHESLLKVLQMQVSSPVPPMRDINPDISPELEAVVLRALAKDPDDRYPTMDAMLFDLQLVLPEGSDALLTQAQFGTSLTDTPFPSPSLRMIAVSSQRLMIGDQDAAKELAAAAAAAAAPSASQRFPRAPKSRKRGVLMAFGLAGVLVAGGAVAYDQLLRDKGKAPVATQAIAAPAAGTPTPTAVEVKPEVKAEVKADVKAPVAEAKAVEPPPTETPVPVAEVVAKPVDDEPVDVPPTGAKKKAPVVRDVRRGQPKTVAVKTVVKAGAKETAKPAEVGSAGPGSAAIAATPQPVVADAPKEPTKVEPPPAGSAAPVVTAPQKAVVAAPVNVGSLDATPTIASLDVNGPLPTSVVRRSVERILPALRNCYRAAAKAKGTTPAVNLTLSFEVDEGSTAKGISASGAAALGTLSGCARSAFGQLQTQQAPDVGTANVVVAITFRPI